MLLGDGIGLRDEAAQVIAAIERALVDGLRTADIAASGERHIGTAEFADAVCRSMPIDVSIGVTPP
jgi:isocitrate/isopropylmalate dehydrogenase